MTVTPLRFILFNKPDTLKETLMAYVFFFIGALFAGMSVALGAYGAHSTGLDEVQALWIEKGARYQMYHGLALLITALALSNKRKFSLLLNLSGLCFIAGTVLFSGSLYAMTFLPFDAGYITPAGGFCFLVGWVLLALSGPGSSSRR